MAIKLEDMLPGVKYNGLNVGVAVDLSAAPSVALPTSGNTAGATAITAASATALTVAAAGTNYGLQVDESTSSAANGLKIKPSAAGSHVAISVISSGSNDGVIWTTKGTGKFTIQPGSDTTQAFEVFRADGTTMMLQVDSSAAKTRVGGNLYWSAQDGEFVSRNGGTGDVDFYVNSTLVMELNNTAKSIIPSGGLGAAGTGGLIPTSFSTGKVTPVATTGLAQTQIVTTDSYYAEVFIPANVTLTGISLLNGHTTNGSVNLSVGLANSAGTIVAQSATTNAQATADTYQKIPFTATYTAVGPAKYYIVVQGSATTGYLATHTIGNFGAQVKTSETFGTFVTTASYSTTTFTTAVGPVADTY